MSLHDQRLEELARRVELVYDRLDHALESEEMPGLRDGWRGWNERLGQIVDAGHDRPEVAISLVGGMGSGKSTLINALIGAKVLPTSNMKACTSAVTEIGYSPGSQYKARIEFATREDLRRELEDTLDQAAATINIPSDLTGDLGETQDATNTSNAARERLLAIFGSTNRNHGSLLEADFARKDLPAEIAEAIDAGVREISCDSLPAFRKELVKYLSSRGQYWPIVRSTKISGPFPALEGGATLVDLPGLNDPNEARERVTKDYIKLSRFIWLVFPCRRLLTKEVNGVLSQFAMEGRIDDLTFIGTASDEIGLHTAIEEFGLDEDGTRLDAIRERNRRARPEIANHLVNLSRSLAGYAGESKDRAEELMRRLTALPVFTVSSNEFLRLANISKDDPAGMTEVEQTEIPALRDHLAEISARHDSRALFKQLHAQVDMILSEIESVVDAGIVQLNTQIETTQQQRMEVEAALDRANGFLKPRLVDLQDRFAQALAADRELLGERLKRAVERGHEELEQIIKSLRCMHWASLRSMACNDGQYRGTAGEFDCSFRIAKPVRNSITFAYADFFAHRVAQALDGWADRLIRSADDQRRELLDALAVSTGVESPMRSDLKRFCEMTGKVLTERLAQTKEKADQKVQEVQKSLHGSITAQIHKNMRSAYSLAAKVAGTGAKARMIEILAKHARQVSEVMFQDAEQAILTGVRELDDWLRREYAGMAETVLKQAHQTTSNLRLGTAEAAPLDALKKRREGLRSLACLIDGLSKADHGHGIAA